MSILDTVKRKYNSVINGLFLAKDDSDKTSYKNYIKSIESGEWKDRVVFGISEKEKGFLVKDPVKDPGVLCAGSMGSGKSIALRHTVYTHMMTNSENTLYILVDAEKNMADYYAAFKYKENVAVALGSPDKMVPILDMVYGEYKARQREFSKVNANSIYSYENKTGKQMARIVIVVEEFHTIPNHKTINFPMNSTREGTAAFQLKQLMRVGRSMGIFIMLASQRGGPSDIPTDLKPGLKNMFAFKMTTSGDAAGLNLPQAVDIRTGMAGRCAYEDGWMQFPYVNDDLAEKLLDKYYKPLSADLLRYSVEDYRNAVGGEGNEGMIWVKPLGEILQGLEQFSKIEVLKRFLHIFNFKVEVQENPALVAHLIAERNGEKYAVYLIEKRTDGTPKFANSLKDSLSILDCKKVMVVGFDMISGSMVELAKETDGIFCDGEDFRVAANLIDNKDSDELKNGEYERLIKAFPMSENHDEETKNKVSGEIRSDRERFSFLKK